MMLDALNAIEGALFAQDAVAKPVRDDRWWLNWTNVRK